MQEVEPAAEVHDVRGTQRLPLRRVCVPLEGVSETQPSAAVAPPLTLGRNIYCWAAYLAGFRWSFSSRQGVDAALLVVLLSYKHAISVGEEG